MHMYSHLLDLSACRCPLSAGMCTYRIAGNFRGVQIFVFFEDAHLSAKLKYRPSSTSKTAARNRTQSRVHMHACKQQRDGCNTSS